MGENQEILEKLTLELEKTSEEISSLGRDINLLAQDVKSAEEKLKNRLRRLDAQGLLSPKFRKKYEDIFEEADV